MENIKPDNIVYSETEGYNASILPYATNVGAPVIRVDDLVSWKSRGISNVNKEFEWNELVYNAKFSFEPVVGEVYHLYRSKDGSYFLSLIGPNEWNREHVGTFKLNSDKKWIHISM